MKDSIVWLRSTRYITEEVNDPDSYESVTDRQERISGFDQSVMNTLMVDQIGAGGLGGEIARGLVRKGVGVLKIFDSDTVELSNLSRQFFYREDLYQNKAQSMAKNLVKEAVKRSYIIAYPFMVQKAVEEKIDISCDIAICAPDNDDARIFTARYFLNDVPIIFIGLDRDANTGYLFIQEPGKACIGCVLPHILLNKKEPCPNTPAVIDLVKIMAGFTLFAVDSTVMQRKRNWNYRQIFLGGFVPDVLQNVQRKKDCLLCSGRSSLKEMD
jgi:molybdopterin/thiamine biosynthesis adenylyltransferase